MSEAWEYEPSPAVGYIRTAYGLKSRFDRLRERGMLTMFEIAKRCGVSTTRFPIGDERVESVRLPLTIETNFSLKIPGLIRQGSTLEELRVTTIRLKK